MTQYEYECLQTKTGQCGGCNIVLIALERAGMTYDRDQLKEVATRTAENWCPTGASLDPLVEALKIHRPSQSIW